MWIGLLRILIKFWTNTYTKASGHIFPAGFDDTADASTTNGSRFQKRNIPESRIFHCGELSGVESKLKLPVQGPHEGPQECLPQGFCVADQGQGWTRAFKALVAAID